MEKENSGPEEADLFCGTNRGPEEAPADAQHHSQCSRSGPRGISPNLAQTPSSLRGPGEAKATSKPFHISVIQAKTEKQLALKPALSLSSTFVCYENQEDFAQKAKRGNWASHEEQAGSHPRGSHNTGLCH